MYTVNPSKAIIAIKKLGGICLSKRKKIKIQSLQRFLMSEISRKLILARKQRSYRAMRQVKKQDFLYIYYAMLVTSALFLSPMKKLLFHNLVFKTTLPILNTRSLQFCRLKREVNSASPGSLHIWYPDREKTQHNFI